MKLIYVKTYDSQPMPSSLKYEEELKKFAKTIKTLKEKYPELTDDEAYLVLRNAVSSVNSYSIVNTETD